MEDLTEQFRTALRQTHGDVDIETRSVTSDQYEGVDFRFRGAYVPVRLLIDVVAEADDRAIESISFIDPSGRENVDAYLSIFVADLSHEQPHPAFVN